MENLTAWDMHYHEVPLAVGICAGAKERSQQGMKVSSAGRNHENPVGRLLNNHHQSHEANDLLSRIHLRRTNTYHHTTSCADSTPKWTYETGPPD